MHKALYNYSKRVQTLYTAISLIIVSVFAAWWFMPSHIPQNFLGNLHFLDVLLFLTVSYIVWHPIVMEVLTWTISSHIKTLPRKKPMANMKVAFITTIVPSSEPVDLLHKCLPAMVDAKYPHDTWLLDEGNSEEIKAICKQYGVNHFSRNGLTEYNTAHGKFTRTKGGNHNSWYEAYGNNYDIVAQIDTDFVPKSDFLTKTLGYFRDPAIAFVGTPQIYGNIKESLIARGAAEQLYTFYGTVLRGLSSMRMTLLIGANHVIRVSALKSVNHYSAHITEDLLTGMKLHANGWKSYYVAEPLAIGEGPNTWESYFSQQLRWAYGCMDILFNHSFKLFKYMDLRRGLYYFFLQQHYFTGIAMGMSVLLLLLYFSFGLRAADINLYQFVVSYTVIVLVTWLMSIVMQRYNIYRRPNGEVLFAGGIISIAAWPVYLLAFLSLLTGKRLKYKVTPKGENDTRTNVSLKTFLPHLAIASISALGFLSSFFTHRQSTIMLIFALLSAATMFFVPFSDSLHSLLQSNTTRTKRVLKTIYKRYTKGILGLENVMAKILFYKPKPKRFKKAIQPISLHQKINDSVFLLAIILFSSALYIPKIGFYSDDWSFIGNFVASKDQSLWGLIVTATTPNTVMRPVQNFYDASLFWLFGTDPFGYQVVIAIVIALSVMLLYHVLRSLGFARIIAVSVPAVYALLPHYSSDRFWFAAAQTNLSIFFYLLSFYTAIRAVSYTTKHAFTLKAVSIISLMLSLLSYEVVLPLYLLIFGVLLMPPKALQYIKEKRSYIKDNHLVFSIVIAIVLAYVLIFKAFATIRLESSFNPLFILDAIKSAFWVNYVTLGINLPNIWGTFLSLYATPVMIVSAIIFYFITFWYTLSVAASSSSRFPSLLGFVNLSLGSIVVFILGYLIFFTNTQVGFSPTGVENRVAIAAAIGVAMTFVGVIGIFSRMFFSERIAKLVFSIVIALMSTGGFITINTLALFWGDAAETNAAVREQITRSLPKLPKNSILLVDGVCPYNGPAPVFEADWDMTGALQIDYNDTTLKADVISPRVKVLENGIQTQIYTFISEYSYDTLYIYNYQYDISERITNQEQAKAYFKKYNADFTSGCQHGSPGQGVNIL